MIRRITDAGGECIGLIVNFIPFSEVFPHLTAEDCCFRIIFEKSQQDKFITAETGKEALPAADRTFQDPCSIDQCLIPDRVSQIVIDRFKIVQVKKEQIEIFRL